MTATIIDGAAVAAELRAGVGAAVASLTKQYGAAPCLAVVLVGDDPASQVYVGSKIRFTEEAGMRSINIRLPAETSEADLLARVQALSADSEVDGILVQLPLPAH